MILNDIIFSINYVLKAFMHGSEVSDGVVYKSSVGETQTDIAVMQAGTTASVVEQSVKILFAELTRYKILATEKDEATFESFFRLDMDRADSILAFFIGFIHFRRTNPVALVERYQEYLLDIISKTQYLLAQGMLNPYFLIEIPQHSATSIETVRPKRPVLIDEIDPGSIKRLDSMFELSKSQAARRQSSHQDQRTETQPVILITPEEAREEREVAYFLSVISTFNEWVKQNETLLAKNLASILTKKSPAEIAEIIARLKISFANEDQFSYGLDATDESGQTYAQLMFSKLLIGIEGSLKPNAHSTEFGNLLRIRNYAENPDLFVLTFLLSLGVSETVCRKMLSVSGESFAKMREIIAQYMGYFSANKGNSLSVISMTLGRECSAFSDWNPFMNVAVAVLDYQNFYKLLKQNFFKNIPATAGLTKEVLKQTFDQYQKLVQNQQSRTVSPKVWELIEQHQGDQKFTAIIEFVSDLYKDRASHNGFGTRMLKMRTTRARLSLSETGKTIAHLLGVEQQTIGNGYVFVPEGVVMWFGAALAAAKE